MGFMFKVFLMNVLVIMFLVFIILLVLIGMMKIMRCIKVLKWIYKDCKERLIFYIIKIFVWLLLIFFLERRICWIIY